MAKTNSSLRTCWVVLFAKWIAKGYSSKEGENERLFRNERKGSTISLIISPHFWAQKSADSGWEGAKQFVGGPALP
jgi:hypothetical protein